MTLDEHLSSISNTELYRMMKDVEEFEKTLVLREDSLIRELHVLYSNILVVAFTDTIRLIMREAAIRWSREIKNRHSDYLKGY